jgi:hypothetical protein
MFFWSHPQRKVALQLAIIMFPLLAVLTVYRGTS